MKMKTDYLPVYFNCKLVMFEEYLTAVHVSMVKCDLCRWQLTEERTHQFQSHGNSPPGLSPERLKIIVDGNHYGQKDRICFCLDTTMWNYGKHSSRKEGGRWGTQIIWATT